MNSLNQINAIILIAPYHVNTSIRRVDLCCDDVSVGLHVSMSHLQDFYLAFKLKLRWRIRLQCSVATPPGLLRLFN